MSTATSPGNPVREGKDELRISPDLQRSVFVIFTSTSQTLKALEKAAEMARPLSAGIGILALQVVPSPLPLERPPVSFEFIVRRFQELISRFPRNARVHAYVCRDQTEALKRILPPNSPVVIGAKKRWWPTRDGRLARRLRRAGHEVTLVITE
jgi:hypothetical protein